MDASTLVYESAGATAGRREGLQVAPHHPYYPASTPSSSAGLNTTDDVATLASFLSSASSDHHDDLYIQQQLVGDDDDYSYVGGHHDSALAAPAGAGPAKRAKKQPTFPGPPHGAAPIAVHEGSDITSTTTASGSGGAAKVRAACSNCRASHVACSHEVPCRRCVEHGLEASCRYLPRKKRTNFKKRKVHDHPDDDLDDLEPHHSSSSFSSSSSSSSFIDREAAQKMEELRRNPPSALLEAGHSGTRPR